VNVFILKEASSATVENPGVKGEGSPWGNIEKLGENFCERSEQSWENFLRGKRAIVGKLFAREAINRREAFCERSDQSWGNFLRAKRAAVGKIFAGEGSSVGGNSYEHSNQH